MLSLETSKTILEQQGNKYTLEETKRIRDLLIELIEIQNIQINTHFNYDKESCINGKGFK
jgi:hypothetical protein